MYLGAQLLHNDQSNVLKLEKGTCNRVARGGEIKMRKYALIIVVLVVASLSAQRWALGKAPAAGGEQAGGQGAGQNGAPRYQGKPMPPNMPGTYTVIRSADLATVLNQTGGDTPLRVADTPSNAINSAAAVHASVSPRQSATTL